MCVSNNISFMAIAAHWKPESEFNLITNKEYNDPLTNRNLPVKFEYVVKNIKNKIATLILGNLKYSDFKSNDLLVLCKLQKWFFELLEINIVNELWDYKNVFCTK